MNHFSKCFPSLNASDVDQTLKNLRPSFEKFILNFSLCLKKIYFFFVNLWMSRRGIVLPDGMTYWDSMSNKSRPFFLFFSSFISQLAGPCGFSRPCSSRNSEYSSSGIFVKSFEIGFVGSKSDSNISFNRSHASVLNDHVSGCQIILEPFGCYIHVLTQRLSTIWAMYCAWHSHEFPAG